MKVEVDTTSGGVLYTDGRVQVIAGYISIVCNQPFHQHSHTMIRAIAERSDPPYDKAAKIARKILLDANNILPDMQYQQALLRDRLEALIQLIDGIDIDLPSDAKLLFQKLDVDVDKLTEPTSDEQAIDDLLSLIVDKHEGGFTNDSQDPGGPTKFGISLKFMKTVAPHATVHTIRNLSRADAINIHRAHFIRRPKFDQLPSSLLRDIVIDSSINHGPSDAARWLQLSYNSLPNRGDLKVDGVVGSITIRAIITADPSDRLRMTQTFIMLRRNYYDHIISRNKKLERYRNGWINRLSYFADRLADIAADHVAASDNSVKRTA